MIYPVDLDTETDLMSHARKLQGKTAAEIARLVGDAGFTKQPKPTGKSGTGPLVERFFGLKPNNQSEPDFPRLGIELKTLPMKQVSRGWTVKEPTSISMIDYHAVDAQSWAEAKVRPKIAKILWVPYEHHQEDIRKSRFRAPFLWTPSRDDWTLFEVDYATVRGRVQAGRAHELSETLSRVLSARRKGAKNQMTSQPHSQVKASSRAWALKTNFTRPILTRHVLNRPVVSLLDELGEHDIWSLERRVVQRLAPYVGRSLSDLSKETGAKIAGGKAGPAAFVRDLMGIKKKGDLVEFEKLGIRIHTVTVNPRTLYPWEAVSFPAMRLAEFAREEWETAEFHEHVDRILFVPLSSEERGKAQPRILGRPFFWSPSVLELAGIRQEWQEFQKLVAKGAAQYRPPMKPGGRRANDLPNMTATAFVHIRPHGANSTDVDLDPEGVQVTKQCFWLNKGYIQNILKEEQNREPIFPNRPDPSEAC